MVMPLKLKIIQECNKHMQYIEKCDRMAGNYYISRLGNG
jgi:hypothetical protein